MNDKIKKECRTLWKNCFHDSEAYMDYYFDEKCKDNHILMDEEDGHVVSMVHLNPYQLMYQGRKIKSYYIVGVSTEEKFRKQGRMRKLLEQAFLQMKEEQIPFTYLMPVNKKIYEPFDFRTIYVQERILVKGIELKGAKEELEREEEAIRIAKEEAELKAAWISRPHKERKAAADRISMKYFPELTELEQEKVISYCNKKLSKEFDIYTVRDKEYYGDLQKEMKAMKGNVAVFWKADYEKESEKGASIEEDNMIGVIPYGMENGYIEVIEALVENGFTEEIVEIILKQAELSDKSKIQFYETYFLDKNVLEKMGMELEVTQKEAIMAKALDDDETFDAFFDGQKVYLNEIV